jgi:hypothetical protein
MTTEDEGIGTEAADRSVDYARFAVVISASSIA